MREKTAPPRPFPHSLPQPGKALFHCTQFSFAFSLTLALSLSLARSMNERERASELMPRLRLRAACTTPRRPSCELFHNSRWLCIARRERAFLSRSLSFLYTTAAHGNSVKRVVRCRGYRLFSFLFRYILLLFFVRSMTVSSSFPRVERCFNYVHTGERMVMYMDV